MAITIKEKIKILLGRTPEVEEITYKGQKGFIPLYFNHTFKNSVSKIFDTDEEKCLENFYTFLMDNKGDTDGTDTKGEQQPS